MNKYIIAIGLAMSLIACKPEGRIYVEHQELSPDVEWLKKDVKEFDVPIKDNTKLYKLSLSFRFASGFQYQKVKVKVTETSPGGKVSVNNYELTVVDDKGNYIGDPALDIWDSEHLVEPNKKYDETGVYKYTIAHNMPTDPLNFAMEIGVVVDEQK